MRSTYRRYVGRKVLIQIGDDTLAGTLSTARGASLVLADAALIESHPVPMDGQVEIPTAGIRWMQVLDG